MAALAALPSARAALKTYLGFLETSGSTTEKARVLAEKFVHDLHLLHTPPLHPQESSVTPNIDRVLRGRSQQRQTKCGGEERKMESERVGGASSSHGEEGEYGLRLMQLERQLSELLMKSKTAQRKAPGSRKPHPHNESTSISSESCDEEFLSLETAQDQPSTSSPHSQPKATGIQEKVRRRGGVDKTQSGKRGAGQAAQWDRNGRRRRRKESEGEEKERGRRGKSVVAVREGGRGGEIEKVSSIRQDQEVKTQLSLDTQKRQETVHHNNQLKVVSQQLEEERERREKSERVASRLVEHVRSLQTQLEEGRKERELAVVRAAKLEGELGRERERGAAREEAGRKTEETVAGLERELESARERVAESERRVREKEEEYSKREAEHTSETTELLGRVRAAELASSGHQREVEMVQTSLAETRRQLQEMQQLLATRERDHQKALQTCKPLDGPEVREMVRCRLEEERGRTEEVVEQHRLRLAEQQKAYQALEDEFRMALRIEASRYQELRESFEAVQGQVEGYESATEAALRKEQKATHMVAELTAIVREQRGRLAEVTRARQDSGKELKERVSELEGVVREKQKLEVRVQSLTEENRSLGSQLLSQQSVMEGLRGERQLWGRELAQQGVELAQDRGRLEAQIESLTSETASLREQLQHARDAVRVKEKVVADQQSSISQLREALADREREGEEARQDWEHEQQSLQLQLEQEQESSAHLQEELSVAVERKAEVKEELAAVREELTQSKEKYSKLRGEWEERVKVIGSLEESLAQVQKTFSEREAGLVREREEAIQRASQAEEGLRESEAAHLQQLEAQKTSHESHVTQLAQRKDQEIQAAHQKVREVEGEMRELLMEVAKEKRTMEARAQRLSLALHQLQQDFSH